MKTIIKSLISIMFVILFQSGLIFAQGTTITILHVNDSHSQLDGTGPRDANLNPTLGGISRAASVIGLLKATEPNPIFLHGGDFSVGDFFFNKYFGVPELQILASLGCDAMTVGNHEFDLGPSTLDMVFTEGFAGGSFPVVSANLDLTGYPDLSDNISPYTIKTVSGVKVGIFGMTIPAPLSNPSPVVIKENIPEIAYSTVIELQSEGCDVIIMLSHLGFTIDSAVASNVPGIDFIVSAHDHFEFAQPKSISSPDGSTYIVQAGNSYKNVGKLKFSYENGTTTFVDYELVPVTSQVPPVSEIENTINYLKQGIEEQYGNVYSTIAGNAAQDIETFPDLNENGWKDSPIGNLVADGYRHATNTTIAITANGLISGKLYHGPLVGADIFRVVSYGYNTETGLGFSLITCKINGSELVKGLETSLSMLGIDNDFIVQISGFSFMYNPSNPVGERVVLPSIIIEGEHIKPYKKYTLTMNEGLYGLLTSLGVEVEKIDMAGISEYDALKNYITSLDTFSYSTEGRITEVTEDNKVKNQNGTENTVPGKFHLYQNFPNPFNPETIIKYEIPISGMVNIKIYNTLGQEVALLINEMQQAGLHEINFNASQIPSGVYFYRLISGTFNETKKMMIVK